TFLGNGETLDAVEQLASASPSEGIAVADMDGDAVADIVAALPAAEAVAIYVRREGRLVATNVDLEPMRPAVLALSDLDADGSVDIVVGGEQGSNLVVLVRRGDSFADPVTVPLGGVVVAIVVSDFDDDGTMDIAAALSSTNEVVMLSGN